jgi:hypothetical protein
MPKLPLSRATDFPDSGLYPPLSRRTFLKRSIVLVGALGLGPVHLNSVRAADTVVAGTEDVEQLKNFL